MDIKEQIKSVVAKVQKDPALLKKFQTEPVKAIEEVLGVDLPDEIIEKVVVGVKAKMTADTASDTMDALKKLF